MKKALIVISLLWSVKVAAFTGALLPLPLAVDNSKTDAFPPIIDQKGGSCAQASGIGYMFTYEINRLLKRKAAESNDNTFAYLFTWNLVNGGEDTGGFVDEGLTIAQRYGVMTNADYGYASTTQFKWASGYEKYLHAIRHRVRNINSFDCTTDADIEKIKRYIFDKGDGNGTGGVLTFSTRSIGWKIDTQYQGSSMTGYHNLLTKLATSGAHAMTIAGYDDLVQYTDQEGNTHRGAFIVVNSWGTFWGDNGRFYLPYVFFTNRKTTAEDVLGSKMEGCDVYINEPAVVFKVRVDYSSRNDLSIVYGAADNRYTPSPQNSYNSVIFYNQGGDYPMRGTYTSEQSGNMEFALDYTDHLPTQAHRYQKYFLNIIRSQRGKKCGDGTLEYLSVIDYRDSKQSPREYVCRNIAGTQLVLGVNSFGIQTRHPGHFSANRYSHITAKGTLEPRTFVLRTAKGHYAKLHFTGNPETPKLNYTILK